MPMIRLDNVCKSYNGRPVLENVSLWIKEGERLCIAGASGCGKTTLLRIIAQLEQPDSGSVEIKKDAGVSMIFQEDRLLEWRTALENLTAVGVSKDEAMFWLAELGLSGEESKKTASLSGGMKRRVAVARALARPGDIMLLDEPIRGLDEENAQRVIKVVAKSLEGRTAVIISHNENELAALGTRILHMPIE